MTATITDFATRAPLPVEAAAARQAWRQAYVAGGACVLAGDDVPSRLVSGPDPLGRIVVETQDGRRLVVPRDRLVPTCLVPRPIPGGF